jgi:predicted TPR repeat methyltransferase
VAPRGIESGVADISSLQQKAVDFAKRGDFGADARAVNEELTRLEPHNEGAWTRLARCCLEAGHLDAASGALESALLLNPQNNLARSLLQEVIRRELLAEPADEAPLPRARKPRSKKTTG